MAKLSNHPEPLLGPAPLLGEHNAGVLADVLSYTQEQVDELKAAGII